ncbi:hypothetical protein VTN00DRAFT_7130 [Thermoascus crustaceus]|uniref:uncharacterized protein n=1 Tax=Thermoascus crustaceus TaxID=5088 RepID=UPI00374488F3
MREGSSKERPFPGSLDCSYDGQGPPNLTPSQESSSSESFIREGSPTKNRARASRPGSGYDFVVEDVSAQDPGYDADVEVVRPYAIEEPEEASTTESPRSTTRRPRITDLWQNDLVDSMRDLDCNSDSNDARPRPSQKRGRKRKPTSTAGTYQHYRTSSPGTPFRVVDMRAEAMGFSPKKMRRRSKRSKEDMKIFCGPSVSPARNGIRPVWSSSSTPLSRDASGTEPLADASTDDKMEVD